MYTEKLPPHNVGLHGDRRGLDTVFDFVPETAAAMGIKKPGAGKEAEADAHRAGAVCESDRLPPAPPKATPVGPHAVRSTSPTGRPSGRSSRVWVSPISRACASSTAAAPLTSPSYSGDASRSSR